MKNVVKHISILLLTLLLSGCGGSFLVTKKPVAIKAPEVASLTLEETTNSIYSMKIPKGWQMDTTGEYESFGFHLYDPNHPERQIFYYGNFSPFLKSEAAKRAWQTYGNTGGWASSKLYADAPILSSPTIDNFYQEFDRFAVFANNYGINHSFPVFGNYQVLERLDYSTPMGGVAQDEGMLRLLLNQNGIPCEGLVTATVVDAMSYKAYGTDTGYYTVYVVSGIIAPADEYPLLEQKLSESLSSFKFSETYINQGVAQIKWETKEALEIGQMLADAYDSYNNAWWARQKGKDITSQQQSDATMGYDRLVDEKTGKVYRAEAGFYDEYKNDPTGYENPNLKLITGDSQLYSEPISGYIGK